MAKELCVLYANCIPVKGASKSIICDLQRNNCIYIPNDLYDILINHGNKSIQEIKEFYKNKYNDIIDNYFYILLNNDLAFLTDTPELFPKLEIDWKEPFLITNAIIDIDKTSSFSVKSVLTQLSDINCKFIQLRFYRKAPINEVTDLLKFLNSTQSNSIGIDILLPFDYSLNDQYYILLFKKFKRLNSLIIHSSPKGKKIKNIDHSRYYINTEVEISSEKYCGFVDKSLFSINTKTYTEAIKFNSCLNRKISIDKHGEIKNCPSMKLSFGNIRNVLLKEVLLVKDFKKYWNVNKDKITVCQECEFRYICTDCRAYLENPEDYKSKPLKCGYDPYKGEWENWSKSELNTQSKTYYNL